MMYNIEKKENYCIYMFNKIELKIKSVDNRDDAMVYVNYNGYNPLLVMLLGNFESECKMDSIDFTIKKENVENDNTMYAIVKKDDLIGFIKDIYFFIVENNLDSKLSIRDKNIWSF